MPMNDNIKLLQDELAKKLKEQKELSYFSSAAAVKAARIAVDIARKNLNVQKNPNWKPHEALFSAEAKHKTESHSRAERKKEINTKGDLKKPERIIPAPLDFTVGAEHKVRHYLEPDFEPLQVHLARNKRNAEKALAERERVEAEQARIEKVRLDRIKYTPLQNKKIEDAHAQFIKETPKSFVRAMLYDMKPVKKEDKDKVVGTMIEKKPGEDSAAAHLDNFNRLQQHEMKEKKQPLFSAAPKHSEAELARKQKVAENMIFKKNHFFKKQNNARLDRVFANQEKIENTKQKHSNMLSEHIEYRNLNVAEAKARDKSYLDAVNIAKNERRANIFDRMGGKDRLMREENRNRLFNTLPSRHQKEITVQNIFASSLKLKP